MGGSSPISSPKKQKYQLYQVSVIDVLYLFHKKAPEKIFLGGFLQGGTAYKIHFKEYIFIIYTQVNKITQSLQK